MASMGRLTLVRKSLVIFTFCLVPLASCLLPLASGYAYGASPRTPGALAKSECESAFGRKALNSAPGTVQDVRTLQVGPGYHPAPHAFAKAPPRESIGWCWTKKGTTYTLYAVAAAYKPVRVEGLGTTIHTPAPGPAPIP
jgi:hypothetical protein